MIVYVSGPMTNMPELNFPAFKRAAASLRSSGYEVINPAEFEGNHDPAKKWSDFLRRDIKALMDCDAIAMLPGWEKSKGARLEKHNAEQLDMRVIFITHEVQ